jgi:hypothetical protein
MCIVIIQVIMNKKSFAPSFEQLVKCILMKLHRIIGRLKNPTVFFVPMMS